MILFLWTAYVRENMLGPSIYTLYVEDTRAPLIATELPENILDPISNKNTLLQRALLHHFDKDGEQLYHKSQFLILFFALDVLLAQEDFASKLNKEQFPTAEEQQNFTRLWQARNSLM